MHDNAQYTKSSYNDITEAYEVKKNWEMYLNRHTHEEPKFKIHGQESYELLSTLIKGYMPNMYSKEEGRVYRRNQTVYHGHITSGVQFTNQKGINKFTPRVTSLVTSFDTIGMRLEASSASFGRAI